MIAVGIPTYNEAGNIGRLVSQIDKAAASLGVTIVIVNADNCSRDGTSDIFQSTHTANAKVPLVTSEKGKGRNVRRILEHVVQSGLDYCMLVDGDVKSFETEWLEKHIAQARRGADYVVPYYARRMHEGNATNHFAFPALNALSQKRAPSQPIAGDIGVSNNFARFLLSMAWDPPTLGYGVDIFVTMNALFHGYKVVEISLNRKTHNPSFDKMIPIIDDVAAAYFAQRQVISSYQNVRYEGCGMEPFALLPSQPISDTDLADKVQAAATLLEARSATLLYRTTLRTIPCSGIGVEQWAEILVEHERHVGRVDSVTLARSLVPFYLLRTVAYLQEARNPADARSTLTYQATLIAKRYSEGRVA